MIIVLSYKGATLDGSFIRILYLLVLSKGIPTSTERGVLSSFQMVNCLLNFCIYVAANMIHGTQKHPSKQAEE